MSYSSKLTISRSWWTSSKYNSKKTSAKKRRFTSKKGINGCQRLMRKINSSKTRNSRLRERLRLISKRFKICKLKQRKKAMLLGRSKSGLRKELKNRESWPMRLKLLLRKVSFRKSKNWLRGRNNLTRKKKRWEKRRRKTKRLSINRFRPFKMKVIDNKPISKDYFSNKKSKWSDLPLKARSLH
jgi:hypothetical protein